jgi:hypothetical protein
MSNDLTGVSEDSYKTAAAEAPKAHVATTPPKNFMLASA